MGIISWIILGLIAGWIASKFVNKTGSGMTMDIALGVVGAIVGGIIASFFGMSGVTGVNIWSIIVSVIGAVVVLWIYHAVVARSLMPSAFRGAPARCRLFVFASGFDPCRRQRRPPGSARFQKGARVFRKSINISAAAKASPRWADATATRTICSPGAMHP